MKTEQATGAVALDKKDLEILRLLQDNAMLTVREVAMRVHLSTTPTHERIKRLEREGVIRQYAALLDHRKIDRGMMVICHVSLKDHNRKKTKAFVDAVRGFKEVIACYNISGEYDFMLKIVARSMEDYHHFAMTKLADVGTIAHLHSVFVMDVIKDTHELL